MSSAFGMCNLTLVPAMDPVVSSSGHIYCTLCFSIASCCAHLFVHAVFLTLATFNVQNTPIVQPKRLFWNISSRNQKT